MIEKGMREVGVPLYNSLNIIVLGDYNVINAF
jgi:hypothetical protein